MSTALLKLPTLSLYIHIPWCIKKCPYCDFNSHQQQGELPEQAYIDALIKDFEESSIYIQNRSLHSIFIGGGTPSLFSAKSFERLFSAINKVIPFDDEIEITLEANPSTFEQKKFADFRHTGINRLSIGIQSFQQGFLEKLGRVHNGQEALQAAKIAQQAGFDNVNLDLMFGLPGQSTKQALSDLQTAVNCHPSHLSWYQLTIEPNTHFYSKPPVLPTEDSIFSIQQAGQSFLAEQGYQQYEISAYSQANRQAKHNLNYWQFGDYLGIGAGAHGKVTLIDDNTIMRTRKTRLPKHYLDNNRPFTTETKPIQSKDLALEFMMNAMRLSAGTSSNLFEIRTGLPSTLIEEQVRRLESKQLLEPGLLKPTSKGHNFLNDLLGEFL